MKYCKYCGTELIDEAVYCKNCGRRIESTSTATNTSSTKTAAKIFMIIGCILSGLHFLIPLCWTIPMTVRYCKSIKNNIPVSTGFKVCSLIFVSLVGGIIMLCDND